MGNRQMKNEKGFTMIEMMIAAAMSIVLLGAAVYTYNKQDKLLRQENDSVQTRDFARLAMDQVANNLLLAGYGFPPGNSVAGRPAQGFTNADVTTLTYRANTDNIMTYVARDAIAAATGFVVPLNTASGIFSVNDTVIFFDVETPTKWGTRTVSAIGNNINLGDPVNYDTLSMSAVANGFDFKPVTDVVAVEINKFHTITYTFNAGAQTITVTDDQGTDDGGTDDTTTLVANRVTDLTFSYFDANGNPLTLLTTGTPTDPTELGNIRKVGISITTVDDLDTNVTATLLTDINLRNMGS